MAASKQATIKKAKPHSVAERLSAVGMDAIGAHVAGGESLNSFCAIHGFAYVTVLDWINADAGRAENYARAREARADLVFERLDEVSEQAVAADTAVEVAGLRLKSDNIKWKLARMSPRYSDKLAIGGAADLPAIKTQANVTLEPSEAYKRMLGGG